MRTFDEINYLDYFGGMVLSARQKALRVKAAEEFEDIFLLYLSGIMADREYGGNPTAKDNFIRDYGTAVRKYADDDFAGLYVPLMAALIEETTLERIGDEYYTSVERAMNLAANEANSVLNQKDFDEYKALGYTRKQWITEKDERVRPTHIEVDDVIIPIDDLFLVGNALMPYPHYIPCGHPEEVANCRCSVEYIR